MQIMHCCNKEKLASESTKEGNKEGISKKVQPQINYNLRKTKEENAIDVLQIFDCTIVQILDCSIIISMG